MVKQFLGLVNYYKRFERNCSEISKPLYQLTEQNCPFQWTEQCQDSFEALQRALVFWLFQIVLRRLSLVGAVLSHDQMHDNGQELMLVVP